MQTFQRKIETIRARINYARNLGTKQSAINLEKALLEDLEENIKSAKTPASVFIKLYRTAMQPISFPSNRVYGLPEMIGYRLGALDSVLVIYYI